MKVFSKKKLAFHRGSAIAIGIFDGVHKGHQAILASTVRYARQHKCPALALTFNPHPACLFAKVAPPSISGLKQRIELLESTGIDGVVVLNFNARFARLTRERFVEEILLKRLHAKFLCTGEDFRFGYKALGTVRYLKSVLRNRAQVHALKRTRYQGRVISSTWIRKCIQTGNLALTKQLLGRHFSITGRVVHGAARGRTLGFRTANVASQSGGVRLKEGVYALRARLARRWIGGALHCGMRPTFKALHSLEAHLFGSHNSFYGKEIELFPLKRIRSIKRFSSAAKLSAQIRSDVRHIRSTLKRLK